jgi:lipoic acid synthetase
MSTRSRANPGGMDVLKVLGADVRPIRERKPPWFKVPPPGGERYLELASLIKAENLNSVDRDDLPDKGARIWAATIRQIRHQAPACKIEVLTPDFQGQEMPLATVLAERPDVFNHNVEVVPRLYPIARRGSTFPRSCRVLRNAKAMGEGQVKTKSGLMVGLSETHEEMVETFAGLRDAGVDILTVGQYLRPSERHLPVVRYWHPDEFAALEEAAYALGFDHVAAGPLVRSSYHADEAVAHDQPGVGPLAAAGAA